MGLNDVLRWLDKKNHVNIVFFFVLLASLLINNLTLIVGYGCQRGREAEHFHGAIFDPPVLGVCGHALLVELATRSAPKYLRWVPWLIVALVPLLVDCRSAARGDVEQDITRRGQCLEQLAGELDLGS